MIRLPEYNPETDVFWDGTLETSSMGAMGYAFFETSEERATREALQAALTAPPKVQEPLTPASFAAAFRKYEDLAEAHREREWKESMTQYWSAEDFDALSKDLGLAKGTGPTDGSGLRYEDARAAHKANVAEWAHQPVTDPHFKNAFAEALTVMAPSYWDTDTDGAE